MIYNSYFREYDTAQFGMICNTMQKSQVDPCCLEYLVWLPYS